MPSRTTSCHAFASPVGTIVVTGDAERIRQIRICLGEPLSASPPQEPLLAQAERRITAYFNGDATVFDLPLAPCSTPRGEDLRDAIASIPHGETASYGELARRIGSSPRAIGQACKRNPFPIVVPCHRVIGTGGTIGHYSGGEGLATKARLLNLEAAGESVAWPV